MTFSRKTLRLRWACKLGRAPLGGGRLSPRSNRKAAARSSSGRPPAAVEAAAAEWCAHPGPIVNQPRFELVLAEVRAQLPRRRPAAADAEELEPGGVWRRGGLPAVRAASRAHKAGPGGDELLDQGEAPRDLPAFQYPEWWFGGAPLQLKLGGARANGG